MTALIAAAALLSSFLNKCAWVRMGAQGDVRLAVAQALADGHDINTLIDWLRGKLI